MKNEKKKLSYLNDLWMYYDDITNRFNINRNKIMSIVDILKKRNELEQNYSSNITKLCEDYTLKYNKKNNIETPFDNAINKIIDVIKEESKIIGEKSKLFSTEFILPLFNITETQMSISNQIGKLMESSKDDFKLINQLLRERELNLMKIGKDLESSMYKLEMAILPKNQIDEKIQDNKNNENESGKINEENNIEEINIKNQDIISYQKNKDLYLKKAKAILFEYESFIGIANEEREKYVTISSRIYNEYQVLDENFIKKIKELFTIFIEKEINSSNKLLEIKNTFLNNYVNKIDIENDINIFINSKIIKFKIPTEIKCLYYSPQVVLKNRNDPIKSKITKKINNELNALFLKNKKEIKEKKDTMTFIKECILLILEEKDYDKNKIMKLLENNENRIEFFRCLNQYRIEGIFSLGQKTYDDLSFLFNYLIKYAIRDKDFDSLKSIIILSQTFYLNSKKDLFLNESIASIDIWKNKNFWEEIIEYSINRELNNSREFYMFLDEKSENRNERINTTITSNIITFLYNMKLLNFPEEKYKELIDDLVQKFKIDGTNVYSTLNSINNAIEIENNLNNH